MSVCIYVDMWRHHGTQIRICALGTYTRASRRIHRHPDTQSTAVGWILIRDVEEVLMRFIQCKQYTTFMYHQLKRYPVNNVTSWSKKTYYPSPWGIGVRLANPLTHRSPGGIAPATRYHSGAQDEPQSQAFTVLTHYKSHATCEGISSFIRLISFHEYHFISIDNLKKIDITNVIFHQNVLHFFMCPSTLPFLLMIMPQTGQV